MDTNEGKDARGASRLHAELGQQAFELTLRTMAKGIERNLRTSEFVMCRQAWNAAIATAAALCDKRATMCGDRADQTEDDEDAIELKARAWQMKVMAAEISDMAQPPNA